MQTRTAHSEIERDGEEAEIKGREGEKKRGIANERERRRKRKIERRRERNETVREHARTQNRP